ncbi:MAG TPA: lysylphosphatidylglycerol synthase domain-containing protein, partial [Burkholderiaceae bacterium]
ERLKREWGSWFRAQRQPERAPGFVACLALFLTHNAAIVVLPMRAGEAGYPLLMQRRFGVPIGESLKSLLWLRLQDAMVLGVLGLAILVPAPLAWRAGFALGAIVVAATLLPALVRRVHVHARYARARSHAVAAARSRKAWHLVAKIAGAFRASRGGLRAWGYAVANWVLKLGIVGALLAPLAGLPYARAFAGALGGELAAVLPLQAPAGVGTYEAGVAVGAQARNAAPNDAETRRSAQLGATGLESREDIADNRRLLFGAALAVHALMVVVALATALVFSLIVRPARAPESPT